MNKIDESKIAREGNLSCEHYKEALERSQQFIAEYQSRPNIVLADQMPFERSPDGLIKHIVNKEMETKECCIDSYMHFLEPGQASGKHRHLSEEVFYVIEGSGYDLHWDLNFDCQEKFVWEWEKEAKKFSWEQGDFVYIPPYSIHQHINDSEKDARLIVITNRIIKDMGFDWFEQIENAEGF